MSILDSLGKVAGAAGAVAGPILNAIGQSNANAENEKLANLAYQRSLPVTQMANLRAAGLNPNLVYGNGSVASGTFSPPVIAPTRVGDAASAILPAISQLIGVIKTQADTTNTVASTNLIGKQAVNVSAQTEGQNTKNFVAAGTAQGDIAGSNATANLATRTLDNNVVQSDLQTQLLKANTPEQIRQVAQNLVNSQLAGKMTQLQLQLVRQQITSGALDLAMRKAGFDPGDHSDISGVARFITTWLSRLGH